MRLMGTHVAHRSGGRAMKLVAIARNGLRVLDDAIVDLRHVFVQPPHALQLLLEKRPVKIRDTHASSPAKLPANLVPINSRPLTACSERLS